MSLKTFNKLEMRVLLDNTQLFVYVRLGQMNASVLLWDIDPLGSDTSVHCLTVLEHGRTYEEFQLG